MSSFARPRGIPVLHSAGSLPILVRSAVRSHNRASLEIDATAKRTESIFLLHSLGSNAIDLTISSPELLLPDWRARRCVPHYRHVVCKRPPAPVGGLAARDLMIAITDFDGNRSHSDRKPRFSQVFPDSSTFGPSRLPSTSKNKMDRKRWQRTIGC